MALLWKGRLGAMLCLLVLWQSALSCCHGGWFTPKELREKYVKFNKNNVDVEDLSGDKLAVIVRKFKKMLDENDHAKKFLTSEIVNYKALFSESAKTATVENSNLPSDSSGKELKDRSASFVYQLWSEEEEVIVYENGDSKGFNVRKEDGKPIAIADSGERHRIARVHMTLKEPGTAVGVVWSKGMFGNAVQDLMKAEYLEKSVKFSDIRIRAMKLLIDAPGGVGIVQVVYKLPRLEAKNLLWSWVAHITSDMIKHLPVNEFRQKKILDHHFDKYLYDEKRESFYLVSKGTLKRETPPPPPQQQQQQQQQKRKGETQQQQQQHQKKQKQPQIQFVVPILSTKYKHARASSSKKAAIFVQSNIENTVDHHDRLQEHEQKREQEQAEQSNIENTVELPHNPRHSRITVQSLLIDAVPNNDHNTDPPHH